MKKLGGLVLAAALFVALLMPKFTWAAASQPEILEPGAALPDIRIDAFEVDAELETKASRILSVAPNPEGTGYYLVDLNTAVYEVSADGKYVGEVGQPSGVESYRPKKIERTRGGYVLEYDTSKFVRLNDGFQPVGDDAYLDLQVDVRDGQNNALTSVFQWTYIEKTGQLLVFGDVHMNMDRWETRCVLVPFANSAAFQILDSPPFSPDLRQSYLAGFSYLVSGFSENGQQQVYCLLSEKTKYGKELGYIGELQMSGEDQASIVELPGGRELLGDDREIPRLADKEFSSAVELAGFLEKNVKLRGLVADGFLGALIHDPSASPEERWRLRSARVQPFDSGSVVETQLLTAGTHLMLVMNRTKGQVAVIRKGPVRPSEEKRWRQDVEQIAEVPRNAFLRGGAQSVRLVRRLP